MIPLKSRETLEYLRFVLSLIFTISLGWWNLPGMLSAQESLPDSLQLNVFDYEIAQAELEVNQTNLLHRLIPEVHLSWSIGLKDILFADPSNALPAYLPKDAYRLNITLSLGGILDDSRHRSAELRLGRLRAELQRLRLHLENAEAESHRELVSLLFDAALDSAGLSMKEEVLRFDELRFRQGKIEYDALMRSRMDVLSAKKSLHEVEHRISKLRLKIDGKMAP